MKTLRRFLGLLPAVLFLGSCAKTPPVITRSEDAKHARIGVMTGTTGETIAKTRFPESDMKSFDDVMDAVSAMKSGQLDAVITSYTTAFQVAKKNPELAALDEHLSDEDSSIGFRKGSDDLLAAVDRILSELKSDGTLDSMKKRWFKPDMSPYEELNIVLPTEGTPLKVGVSATREPFNFVDKDGRVTGHDGELARIIASRLHRPLEFSNMKFMALIPALQSGKVDMIISGMTATPERKKFVDFSQPYFINAQVMLVRRSTAAAPAAVSVKLVSPADLRDKRIGVFLGSAQDAYAAKAYPNATILQYSSTSDLVLAVKFGKVDAALDDEEPLREILRDNDSIGLVGESYLSSSVGAGFNKNADELRQNFNRFLSEIKRNGVYAGMVDRWMHKRESRMPEIDHSKSTGELVVGVSAAGIPFTFLRDNRLLGFDVELAERFGAAIGKEVKLANMEFGGLIAAVASGKVDMIVSSIYITDERKKQILFSDPYYEMGNRVFALKSNIAAYDTRPGAKPAHSSFFTSLADSFYSNIIEEKRYLLIWDGLKTTAMLSVFSTIFGTLLGALICFMRISKRKLLNVPAKIYISILRGTPVLVLLMLIFYVVFASVNVNPVLAATVAFGMNFAAYVAEIFRTGIEGVDKGQTEAGIAMGFSKAKTFLYIVLPQTIRRILPVYKGEFISMVKMTSIVGYIAVQDLTKASDIIRSRTFDAFFPLVMVAAAYFTISWVLLQSLQYLERATDPKFKRQRARLA